jgi:predicted transcriptional regulator of viral defense system
MNTSIQSIRSLFKKHNGYLQMKDLKSAGVPTRTVAALVRDRVIEKIKPGLYRLADLPEGKAPRSFYDVAVAVPKAVICLQSALEYHGLTTLNPGQITVAVPNSFRPPEIIYPPVQYFFFRDRFYSTGIETIKEGPVIVRIYSKEKCICDAFHLRRRIGEELAFEVLKNYLSAKGTTPSRLLAVAKACGMQSIILPSLKAMVA